MNASSDVRSFGAALHRLSSAQKSRRGVSLYSRFVNRPLGRVLAAASYRVGLSPNQVTLASAVVTAAGLVVLVAGAPAVWRALTATVLLVLGFALDSADGQVSRLTGRSTLAGEWLDHVVDAGKMVAVHTAVLVMLWAQAHVASAVLLVPLAFQFVAVVLFSGGVLVDLLKRTAATDAPATKRTPSTLRAIALLPADYGILAVSFVLSAWLPAFLIVYAALLACNIAITVLLLAKWFRELAQLRRPR